MNAKEEKLYLIDSISPFILSSRIASGRVINWSKTPFSLLERNGAIPLSLRDKIRERFLAYARQISLMGFNALSMDDLSHLVIHDFYSERIKDKIRRYSDLYRELFSIALESGLKIYLNTDSCSLPDRGTGSKANASGLMLKACEYLFERYQSISGMIVRIGECDGKDVRDDFRSHLIVRTAGQAREFIQTILPCFERRGKTLIMRTWSVGAYSIGDLIWNPVTYRKVFEGLSSEHLIVSHKYGDTDFFRYLDLNPLIFQGAQKKIVEFQTRREFEGFGEFPSFTGYYYEKFRERLTRFANFAGIHAWCQTGGWSRFSKPTFMPGSSIWNELNTSATISLFRDKVSPGAAARRFCEQNFPKADPTLFVELARLSSIVVDKLWYIPEFSASRFYLRRTRLPPLLWIFWDTILFNRSLRALLRCVVRNPESAIKEGYETLENIDKMLRLARLLRLDEKPFRLQKRTFELVALARHYHLGVLSEGLLQTIKEKIRDYRRDFPDGFSVEVDMDPIYFRKTATSLGMKLLLRRNPHYRIIDYLICNVFLSGMLSISKPLLKRHVPRFARDRAMGIGVIFK